MYTRQDISMDERLEIFSQFWRFQDDYGYISRLAREWKTSRHFIYSLVERVKAAVDWRVSGRKPQDDSDTRRIKLKDRIRQLESDCETLKAELEIERSEKLDRRFGLLMELALCPVSEDKIIRCMKAAFGVAPSAGWINEQINRAGCAALNIMQREEVRRGLKEAALDEIFTAKKPILTLVDPHSMMALVPEACDNRKGETWKRVIDQYPHLELVVSDQGSGLLKGVNLSSFKKDHQYDLFHFKRSLKREIKRLEDYCYREIERVDKARELISYPRLLSSARIQAEVEYREKAASLDKKLLAFDMLELIEKYLEEAFEVYDEKKQRLRTYSEAQGMVDEVLELLEEIRELKVCDIAKQIEGARDGLFTYLKVLESKLRKVPVKWRHIEGSRSDLINHLVRVWYQRRNSSSKKALREYSISLMGLEYWERRVENFSEVREKVFDALERMVRASSAVECLNSILRPYSSVKKRLNQRFLALIALYWNMHPLARRGGRTPFEIAGVDVGTNDWIELLELELARSQAVVKMAA